MAVLDVSASAADAGEFFREERQYRNVGLSRRGEPVAAAWLISSYSEERSTAFRPFETKKETFTVAVPAGAGEVRVIARVVSRHGLPVEFGKPAEGMVVLEESHRMMVGPD
jgi:hypothetical protein